MLAKISDEFASRNGNRGMIGRSRALNEAHEVGRADHVEIDVEHDVTTVIFGQTVDMLTRAHEALLLCSPEGETHATACSGRLPHHRNAASSTAAAPLPLSLMPGPSSTLSRCAPTTIKEPSLPAGVSANTFRLRRFSVTALTARRTVAPSVRPAMSREWPCSYEIPTTGMAAGCLSVPEKASVRRSVPSFMMTTPMAPAATAFSTLVWNGQVPRRISATEPGLKSWKSTVPHPLADAIGDSASRRRFTERSGPVTSPEPELTKVRTASADAGACAPPDVLVTSTGGARSSKKGNSNSSRRTT